MFMRYTHTIVAWLVCMRTVAATFPTPQQLEDPSVFLSEQRSVAVWPTTTLPATHTAPLLVTEEQVSSAVATDATGRRWRSRLSEAVTIQRAWMYSAILPGWGQLCNKDYWKVPVMYVAFAGLGWGATYYHKQYVKYRRVLLKRGTGVHDSLNNYVDASRIGRDLCVILAALWYVVNIFDAYVGASLKTFTLSDDVSLQWQPTMLAAATHHRSPSLGLSISLNLCHEDTSDRLRKNGTSR